MTAPRAADPADAFPLPLWRQARERPDAPAIVAGGAAWTYRQAAIAADAMADLLESHGVRPGDRLAWLLADGPRAVLAFHAAWRLGAVACPVNTRLTAAERGPLLDHLDPRLVVAEAPWLVELRRAGRAALDASDLGAGAPAVAARADTARLGDTAAIVYTSGTGGRPKGVMLGHGGLLWSAFASALRLGGLPGDRWLAALPLFHVGGLAMVVRAALGGAALVFPSGREPADLARAVRDEGVSLASLVPTQLERLLDAWGARAAPPALRAVLVGGGPLGEALRERALAAGWPIAPTYGLTEASSQVATTPPGAAAAFAPPLPFTRVQVRAEDGQRAKAGEVGEIWVAGPTLLQGYWRPGPGGGPALRDGWLHTGDLGELDAAGALRLARRREDLIVSGGENVDPGEVEARLGALPGIADCAVFGAPHAVWGQAVAAAVVPRDPADLREPARSLLERRVDRALRRALAGYKRPRAYLWLAGLPRNPMGKVERGRLRELLAGRSSEGDADQT